MTAADEVIDFLEDDEMIDKVVFGPWGWNGYEETTKRLPKNKRGVLLTWGEAKKYMAGWSFGGGFGSPDCYAVYIWTNQRVIWVQEYDGSTDLQGVPRNPIDTIPVMR